MCEAQGRGSLEKKKTSPDKMQPEVRECWSRVEGSRNGEVD